MNLTGALWATSGILVVITIAILATGSGIWIENGRLGRRVISASIPFAVLAFGFAFAGIWSAVR